MEWIMYIFIGLFLLIGIYLFYRKINEWRLFKQGRNPYKRICRKCGAHQDLYQSNIEGCEHAMWWEEVYPIGNNPKCKCHSYASYR